MTDARRPEGEQTPKGESYVRGAETPPPARGDDPRPPGRRGRGPRSAGGGGLFRPGPAADLDGLSAAVDRLATGLLDLGVGPGDRVGIWAPNRPEWLLTQFAAARVGRSS